MANNRPGQWMRAAGSPDQPAATGNHPLLQTADGSTLTTMWWTLNWYWADRPLLLEDVPPPVSVWGLYLVNSNEFIPDVILDRNASWLWWEAMVWEPLTWSVQHDVAEIRETTWTSPGQGQGYRHGNAQRTAFGTSTLQLVWATTTPGYPVVMPRISLSAYVYDPL